jgi:16S rRNA processing protein RimM
LKPIARPCRADYVQGMKNPVQMAVIGAPHGIKGELRVKTFTGDPEALADYGPLFDEKGRSFTIETIRPAGNVVVVRFSEVRDRNAAEAMTGTALFLDRSVLPDTEEEDEFYHADLVGLSVQDSAGETLGKVVMVQNFGGGDILEVKLASGREVLVPFTRAAVPLVALSAGFVQVDPVAAGLVEDDEERDPVAERPRGPKNAGGNR